MNEIISGGYFFLFHVNEVKYLKIKADRVTIENNFRNK